MIGVRRPGLTMLALGVLAALAGAARADGVRRLFEESCGGCHFDGATEGALDLDALFTRLSGPGAAATGPDHAAWLAVLENLRAETMPPADEPRPTPEARRRMIGFVERDAFAIDPSRPDPGHVVLRRLNRSEYGHTIRDLTGLDLDPANELPTDDSGYGFDTIGEVLTMSPLLVEKYLAVATRIGEAVADEAVATEGRYPEQVRRVFPLGPEPADTARRAEHLRDTIARLGARAFRRPLDAATCERLLAIAAAAIDAPGGSFERGVAAALTAMLAAPRFLFRVEQPAAGPIDRGAVPLDDHSLATRLSYLLWSSLPDDDLVEVARAGELHQRLGEQVDRLIADARADRFVADFVGQWLKTRDVETAAFDVREILRSRDQFMAERIFSPRVRAAMRQETELLVARLLRDDRPATDLLVARETFLNSRLARFYGIPGVEGPEMRLVSLAPDSHRGGLLTHASFLAVTSNPTRTSPVKRGLFILENLLGTPTPPPPPDVPPLEAAARSDRRPSMRELMELHRRDALCASCHERMDPLGLALEGYNALGQWRGHDADGLDTSGRLVTGETFADARELAEVIAGPRRRDFHRCLAEKLLTYALGRGLEYFDGPAVDTIVDEMERDGGGLRALVQAVCRSVPFRMMRPPQPAEPSP
jgi:mono/diheme cytochrome c family protein